MTKTFDELLNDLTIAHGEQNGGIEDFYKLNETTIGCRYGDCCICLKEGGWYYGGNLQAHQTPLNAFESRVSDYYLTNGER